MPVIHKATTIHAPTEKVFQVLEDPSALPQYAPGVVAVSDIQHGDQHIGDSFQATYSVLGVQFPMKFTTVEYARPTKLVAQMEGGMKGSFRWTLEPQGDATRVSVDVDYQVPGGILGKVIDSLLLDRMNEKNTERMLEDLKMLTEPR